MSDNHRFVDVLTLRDGKTVEDARAYFDRACPVIEKHGVKRINFIAIDGKLRGHEEVNPSIVQTWEFPEDNPFPAIQADPDYQQLIPLRDSVFDMEHLQGWFGTEREAR